MKRKQGHKNYGWKKNLRVGEPEMSDTDPVMKGRGSLSALSATGGGVSMVEATVDNTVFALV